jgi:hypothetical protein
MPMKTRTSANDVMSRRKSQIENFVANTSILRRSVRIPMLRKKNSLDNEIKAAVAVVEILHVEKNAQLLRRSVRHAATRIATTEDDRSVMREKRNAIYSAQTSEEEGSIEGSDEKSGGDSYIREPVPNYRRVSEECGRNIDLVSEDEDDIEDCSDQEHEHEHEHEDQDNNCDYDIDDNDDRDSFEESDDDLTALYKQQSSKEIGELKKIKCLEKRPVNKNERESKDESDVMAPRTKRNLSERKRCNDFTGLGFTMKKTTKNIYHSLPYEGSSEDRECSRASFPHTGYRCSKQLGNYTESAIDRGLQLWDRW